MANQINSDVKLEELYSSDTPEKVEQFYQKWAGNGKYDKDMASVKFVGPAVGARTVGSHFLKDRDQTTVLDVAAGTGQVAVELFKLGFRKIDALDPCQPMLDKARQRRVYRNFYCNAINGTSLTLPEGSYDAVITVGCIADGHLPADSIYEMTRLTKPGGIIVLVGNAGLWRTLPEYSVKMAAMIKELENNDKLLVIEEKICDNYRFSEDLEKTKGIVVTMKRL